MKIQNLSSLLFVLWTRRSSSFASSVSIPFVTTGITATGTGTASTSRRTTTLTTTPGRLSQRDATTTTETDYSNYKKDNDDKTNYMDRLLHDSLSLVGRHLIPSTFGGVAYYNTAQLQEFRVLFILGGPGAGKGTQCERLTATSSSDHSSSTTSITTTTNNYPCVHLSVGELLRAEQTRMDSPHRALIQDCLVSGRIVPVDVSLALLHRAMEEAAAVHGRSTLYLVDGFPRNYDNLEGWNRFMTTAMDDNHHHPLRRTSVWGVLLFTCPLAILEQRILTRAETSGRSDDNIISAQKRFQTFQEQTMPVVELLRQVQQIQDQERNYGMPLQVHDIRGDLSIEQVWDTVQQTVQQFLANDIWTANAKLIEAVETQNETLYRQLCPYMMMTSSSDSDVEQTSMAAMEGTYDSSDPNPTATHHHVQISNASIRFETGTKAITSYDRVVRMVANDKRDDTNHDNHGYSEETIVREERVWSHEGTRGWVNVHFTRTPKQEI